MKLLAFEIRKPEKKMSIYVLFEVRCQPFPKVNSFCGGTQKRFPLKCSEVLFC